MNKKKKAALRIAFVYPAFLLVLAIAFGVLATSGNESISRAVLENAVRGMTALALLAVSGAAIGFFQVKQLLFEPDI